MNKLDPKDVGGKVERTGSAGDDIPGHKVVSTPGGPGWVSEHSMILWIGGIALGIAALITYMIIDN